MPWSSVEVRASSVQVKFAPHETVKAATGGWLAGGAAGAVTVTIRVVVFVRAPASPTVSETVYVPPTAYVCAVTDWLPPNVDPSPKSQLCVVMSMSSRDALLSNRHVSPLHAAVNEAVGGWFGPPTSKVCVVELVNPRAIRHGQRHRARTLVRVADADNRPRGEWIRKAAEIHTNLTDPHVVGR